MATKPIEPFVLVDDDELRGYSIDLWAEIASELDLVTEFVVLDTVEEILVEAELGRSDVALAAISMTPERESVIDFTHPYFDAGLQVAARPTSDPGAWDSVVDVLASRTVIGLVLALLLLTAVVSHVVWWGERRHNPEFPSDYRSGIGEALWWSSVSLVTGGEAVKTIRRPLSRLMALLWMVTGLFLIAFVTAQAASSLTLNELQGDIEGIDDLAGRPVVTVEGTVAESFLRQANLGVTPVSDLDTALEQVVDGSADAVVFDSPVLAYRLDTDYAARLELVGPLFSPDPYGIALTEGSELREPINEVLLRLARDGTLDALHSKWLGITR